MVFALECLRADVEFMTGVYDFEAVKPYEKRIKGILGKRQMDASADWKTFAAYSVMGKRSIGRIGTYTQTSVSFIVGSLILLAVTAATGRPVTEGLAENIAVVLYCGIVVTGIGYLFYFLAIRYSDASTGSITFFIKPAIAPIFAVLILHETVRWNTIVGIILLVTASVITITDTVLKRKEVAVAESA